MSPQRGPQNSAHRLARYAGKALQKARHAYLRAKYHDHAFPQSFGWEWGKINYNRIALVNFLISKKQQPAYLEIGCASNGLFDSIPCIDKIGVDPAEGGTIRATSDEFFKTNTRFFDVVFIDGLHTYEQVRRDVINSIRCLNRGGYVALHDMLPDTWVEHHVPRVSLEWTGDVWKVAFEILQSIGIEFKIVKIDHGVGVFRVCDEKAALMDLNEELKDKEFEYLYRNVGKLPVIEWQDFVNWVG